MAQAQILIVDDQPRTAQSLARMLSLPEGGGYRTETCESGEEALERLEKAPFDLVITDLRMSGITGLELLKQAHLAYPSLARILMTGYASPEIQEEASQVADAYLIKPINPRELVDTVRNVMQGRAGVTPVESETQEPVLPLLKRCEQLRMDVGAVGVQVIDRAGRIVTECGQRGSFDVDAFMAFLGSAMAAINKASDLLQEDESFDLHLHQGKKYDIYTVRVSEEVILSMTLDRRGANAGSLGMAWISLRRAIGEIRALTIHPTTAARVQRPGPPVEGPATSMREPDRMRPESESIRRPPDLVIPKRKTETIITPPPASEPAPTSRPPDLVIPPRKSETTVTAAPNGEPEAPKADERPADIAAIPARPKFTEPPPSPPPPPSVFTPANAALQNKDRLTFEEALKLGLINPDTLGPLMGGEDNPE